MAQHLVLDISKYNAIEDYNAAAGDIEGVLIRAGYRGYGSSGSIVTDNLFETHYNGFIGKGIPIGVYWFTQAISEAEAIEEANYVYELIKDKDISFPVYIDSEYSNNDHNGRADSLSATDRTTYLIAFCERIKELGYRAGVYASDSWFVNQLDWNTLTTKDYSIWVANYSTEPSRVSYYDAWQYTSDGTISGYSGRVDYSYFYEDVAGWGDEEEVKDLANATVTLDLEEAIYHGGENRPAETVKYNGVTLTYGKHYDRSFEDNINVGTGKVIINGIGNYTGTNYATFIISPRDLSTGSIDVGEEDENGCVNIDNIVVTCIGFTLVEDVDYTLEVSYSELNGYKLANCVVTGIGNYTGTLNGGYFVEKLPDEEEPIEPEPDVPEEVEPIDINTLEFTVNPDSYTYTGEAFKPVVNNTDGLIEDTDYTVDYNGDFTNVGEHQIIIAGIGNYTGSIKYDITINPAIITEDNIVIDSYEGIYDINSISVVIDNRILKKDIDYTIDIQYVENKETMFIEAIVTINGIGNYTGIVTQTYNINKIIINISTNYYIDNIESVEYTGNIIEPIVLVTNGQDILVENTDYIVKYNSDFTNVGNHEVIVNGINNYSGTLTSSFVIESMDITDNYNISISVEAVKNITDISTLKITNILSDEVLELDKDYTQTIEYFDDIEIMSKIATVTINGIGNYTGYKELEYIIGIIEPIDISNYSFRIEDNMVYNFGYPVTPKIDSEDLEINKDYIVEYSNNINVGTGIINIKGIGLYSGIQTINFDIIPYSIESGVSIKADILKDDIYDINTIKVFVNKIALQLIENVDYTKALSEVEVQETMSKNTIVVVAGIGNYKDIITETFKTGILEEELPEEPDPEEPDVEPEDDIYTGKEVELKETILYPRYCSRESDIIKSGKYYIFDSRVKNNRVRVTNNKKYVEVPGHVSGWIDIIEDNNNSINIGDIVIVEGELYKNPDGSGYRMIKNGQIMYVVAISDDKYNIGVASDLNRTCQGWGDINSIKKYTK